MDLAAAHQHCLELVRDHDKDRYLAALFAPEETRGDVLALYAFNVELSRIRDHIREPTLGEMRLTWWSDQVEAMGTGHDPDHPVGQALAAAVRRAKLPTAALVNMIEARRFDLYDDPMPTLNDLEGYLGETASALILLSGFALAGPDAARAAGAAGAGGVAMGLAGLMRALAFHRARGQCYVPVDLLARHGLTPAHVLAGRETPEMAAVLAELRAHALIRLGEARAALGNIPEAALPAFLPVGLVDGYLKALGKAGSSALVHTPVVPQWRRQLTMFVDAWRDRF